LVAQYRHLDVFGVLAPQAPGRDVEEPVDDEVEEG
jgi:hypothetical protein